MQIVRIFMQIPTKNDCIQSPSKFSKLHSFEFFRKVRNQVGKIQSDVPDNHTGRAIHKILRYIKDCHDNIPCVSHDQYSAGSLEHPFVDV